MSVNKTLLLCQPLPCSPAAEAASSPAEEAAIKPLTCFLKANLPICLLIQRSVFFTDTGITQRYVIIIIVMVYVYRCMYVYIYIYIYIHRYVYIYIYIILYYVILYRYDPEISGLGARRGPPALGQLRQQGRLPPEHIFLYFLFLCLNTYFFFFFVVSYILLFSLCTCCIFVYFLNNILLMPAEHIYVHLLKT